MLWYTLCALYCHSKYKWTRNRNQMELCEKIQTYTYRHHKASNCGFYPSSWHCFWPLKWPKENWYWFVYLFVGRLVGRSICLFVQIHYCFYHPFVFVFLVFILKHFDSQQISLPEIFSSIIPSSITNNVDYNKRLRAENSQLVTRIKIDKMNRADQEGRENRIHTPKARTFLLRSNIQTFNSPVISNILVLFKSILVWTHKWTNERMVESVEWIMENMLAISLLYENPISSKERQWFCDQGDTPISRMIERNHTQQTRKSLI